MSATAFESLVVPAFQATLLGMAAGGLAGGALRVIGRAWLRGPGRVPGAGSGCEDGLSAGPALADDREGPASCAEAIGAGQGGKDGREALTRMGLTPADRRPANPRDDLARL